jgi:hypothetical protein
VETILLFRDWGITDLLGDEVTYLSKEGVHEPVVNKGCFLLVHDDYLLLQVLQNLGELVLCLVILLRLFYQIVY